MHGVETDLEIRTIDRSLYNADLAPIECNKRSWGRFEIFNVWSNVVQSLFGYTLAASFFLTYGLNGWAVFGAVVVSGFIIMFLCNLSGAPSVRYGIPYPVMARASMGVRGANLPAMTRGIVALFWYGAQTYFASTAVVLLINSLLAEAAPQDTVFLGLTWVGWVSLLIVWLFQTWLFWNGIEWIRVYLNWAAPAIYGVMIALLLILWSRAGNELLGELGSIFEGEGSHPGGPVAAFLTIVGTMIAFYAPIVLNYGDFARYVRRPSDMRFGNLVGLPFNVAFFALIALFMTAGTVIVFGERLTNPTDIIEKVDNLALTIVAAVMFFAATVGINMVANFVPPANDFSNLLPRRISFRSGGAIASCAGLVIAALWVTVIERFGISHFVNSLGAVLAPAYGIMIADYYFVKKNRLDVQHLFSSDPQGAYYYVRGWNRRALAVFILTGCLSVLAVWLPSLQFLNGFSWLLGALVAGVMYAVLASAHRRSAVPLRSD